MFNFKFLKYQIFFHYFILNKFEQKLHWAEMQYFPFSTFKLVIPN